MAIELLPEGSWGLIEPFIPVAKAKLKGGRPRLADRALSHPHNSSCVVGFLGAKRLTARPSVVSVTDHAHTNGWVSESITEIQGQLEGFAQPLNPFSSKFGIAGLLFS
jgi:hypothetical protein